MFLFYTPWKYQKTYDFKSGTLVENGLNINFVLPVNMLDLITVISHRQAVDLNSHQLSSFQYKTS